LGKYFYKSLNRASVEIVASNAESGNQEEIKQFLNKRYVAAFEQAED
jgi:hypothetical protein